MTSTQVVETSVTTNKLHQPGRSNKYKYWLTRVTTNNSISQDYINPDDQPTTNINSINTNCLTDLTWLWRWLPHRLSKSQAQLITVLSRTTSPRTINQPQTLTHLGHHQQQSLAGLHHPGRSTNHKHWLAWVTNNNSPLRTYTNPDNQPTTNIDSPKSPPTTVLLRTASSRTINQPQTLTHLGYNQQQSFSGLHQPGRSTNHKHWLTWVTTNNNPSQDYTNPDDQPITNIGSPGFSPFIVLTN